SIYNIEEFRSLFLSDFISKIESSEANNIIISSENLFALRYGEIVNLLDFLYSIFKEVKIVVYLRRQDKALLSIESQRAKEGVERLINKGTKSFPRLDRVFNYYDKLQCWREHLIAGVDDIIVRSFEKNAFIGGDLIKDFIGCTGVNLKIVSNSHKVNESLSCCQQEFLFTSN
ncbi:hypothetical protein, partial [Vibrio sp. 10N.222.54.B11]|uniref:hypothetical protein n=1 Tax=Vibrio sp. 10N.222.54.B11 TaxID=3229635 RepID=UPI0035508CFD